MRISALSPAAHIIESDRKAAEAGLLLAAAEAVQVTTEAR
jgi:hypothetical protein